MRNTKRGRGNRATMRAWALKWRAAGPQFFTLMGESIFIERHDCLEAAIHFRDHKHP